MSRTGEPPVRSATRQPHSGEKLPKAQTATIAAVALAIDAIACTMAVPKPRRSLGQTSFSSTMPAPHSPPNPMPATKRNQEKRAVIPGEGRGDGAAREQRQRQQQRGLAPEPVAEPAEQDAAGDRAKQRDGGDGAGLREADRQRFLNRLEQEDDDDEVVEIEPESQDAG